MESRKHDVVIIGGGSAGYAAARTAQEAGADVGIVDSGPLGGLCILRGCMPTKAILRSSNILALMRQSAEFGLRAKDPQGDLAAILKRKDRLIEEFAAERIEALRDDRFTLYEDRAVFTGPREVASGNMRLQFESAIIATGSVPSRVPIPGLDEVGYLTSDEILSRSDQPASLIVLGGGPVAAELAQFFQRLGTQVSLIQRSDHILSDADTDLAHAVEDRFRDEGMALFTGARLQRVERDGKRKRVHFTRGTEKMSVAANQVLQALGRQPNLDGLHLEAAGVEANAGGVLVDVQMRTSQPHIYAVGDVNGIHEIVHIAIAQGEIAAHNATHPDGPPQSLDDRLTTQIVFTEPQVASVGLSEKQCLERHLPYLKAQHRFDDHGKSLCLGESYGHVKLLCEPRRGTLLGCHIVGPDASELIHELIAVMYFHGTVSDLARIPHYHPTLAEILLYPAEELAAQIG
jgi:pyruvate/2-oxoglutarate dehydrogenase complex dihydrolipoamide dehydrogenase (E3) component